MSWLDSKLQGRTLLPRRLRRRDVTTYHEEGGPIVVHHIPVIATPYPSPWEHPIYWWKMRHLRHDIKLLEDEIGPLTARFREMEDELFLTGTTKHLEKARGN